MSQLYHFSRKKRQLKNKLKAYELALLTKQNEQLDRLKFQIIRLSIYSNRKLFRKLALLGIFCTLGNPIKAQDILLNPPVPVDQTMRLINAPTNFADTTYQFFGMPSQDVKQVRFIDIDDDGDLDAFFTGQDEECYVCYDEDFNPFSINRLFFQENISSDTVAFDSVKLLLSFPFPIFPLPFELVDFDDDNDLDAIFSNTIGFFIYENTSNQKNIFDFSTPSDTLLISTSFLFSDLYDIDEDGDLDIVSRSWYTINDFFYFENNGNEELFPFDTIQIPIDLGLNLDTTILNEAYVAIDFVDIDNDGNEDLLLQAYFLEDDLNDYNFPNEKRLYYFKNLTATGYNFDPNGEILIERDLRTYPGESSFHSTHFNAVDIDGDGDIDINEIETATFQGCGYCGSYTGLSSVLIYKNVIEEITSISGHQNVLELEILGNPTHDKSIIRFKNESQNTADLKIYNSTGVLVEHLNTNQSSFIINRKNLANGIYIYSVILDGKAASGKLVFH